MGILFSVCEILRNEWIQDLQLVIPWKAMQIFEERCKSFIYSPCNTPENDAFLQFLFQEFYCLDQVSVCSKKNDGSYFGIFEHRLIDRFNQGKICVTFSMDGSSFPAVKSLDPGLLQFHHVMRNIRV